MQSSNLEPGTLLENRYQIVRSIRAGGMGAVYEAIDTRLARSRCAVKQILAQHVSDDVFLRRFYEEMEILSKLHHQGIPRVRDYFIADSNYTIVMDFVEGQDLEQELEQCLATTRRPLEPAVAIDVAIQVLDILEYLHGQSPPVLHRDIKPSNLIRQADSRRICLVDFGLARLANPDPDQAQTQVGTLGYCPMEQLKGLPCQASDIYGLGATLFNLLSGGTPTPFSIPPLASVATVDAALAAIVDRALAEQPEDRYADAATFKKALLTYTLTPAPSAGVAPKAGTQPTSWIRPLAAGSLAFLGLALMTSRFGHQAPSPAPLSRIDGPSPAARTPTPLPTPAPMNSTTPIGWLETVHNAEPTAVPGKQPVASADVPISGQLEPSPAYPRAQPGGGKKSVRTDIPTPEVKESPASTPTPVAEEADGFQKGKWQAWAGPPLVGQLDVLGKRGNGTNQSPSETWTICHTPDPPGERLRNKVQSAVGLQGWSVDEIQDDGTHWLLSKPGGRAILTIYRDEPTHMTSLTMLTRRPCEERDSIQTSYDQIARDYGWMQ
jgi:serine/threonine protein kinase